MEQSMRHLFASSAIVAGLLSVGALALQSDISAQDKPKVAIPQPGVKEIATIEGRFVRAAYNNEGYVILGYQAAQRSLGEEWLLLETGITLRSGVPDYTIKREAISLETPDGTTLPLPSIAEFRKANTSALQAREKVHRDSINYFPPNAIRACAMLFFPDITARTLSYDEVEITQSHACLGRLFFQIPGGIKYGQHWLNVKFAKSLIRVPFRIFTKEEEKFVSKNYSDIRKQVQEAFAPKKK
jgi:hypothetical protein